MCNRPWSLKQRILDDCGHLSNEDSAYALSQLIGDKTRHIYLAHLSQDANLPDLAEMTVRHILKEENVKATFFVIGKYVKNNPDIVKREYEEGEEEQE